MKPKRQFLQQNMAALGIAGLVLLCGLLILVSSPRPGLVDTGLYDRILPQLSLTRIGESTAGTQVVTETFQQDGLPWGSLVQFVSGPSLIYPAAVASVLCAMFGQPFSTEILALVLLIGFSVSIFYLTKALCSLFGGFGVLAAALWGALTVCGNYLLLFNSLYPWAMFLVSLTAFLAAAFRGAALKKQGCRGVFLWIPAALTGLLLLTASELSVVLLLPVLGVVLWLGIGEKRGWVLLAAGLLSFCCIRFTFKNNQVFNRTNLYHSFFDGLLTVSPDPKQTLADFGLEEGLLADMGKSAYLPEEDYYVSPNGDRAAEIFDHISYPKIAGYYLRHPALMGRLAAQVLDGAGHVDTSLCVSASGAGNPAPRGDYWDLTRSFCFRGAGAFLALSALCLICGMLSRKKGLILFCLSLPLEGFGMLLLALLACGLAEAERNRIYFQMFADGQAALVLTSLAVGVQLAVREIAYSSLSARKWPEPLFPAEDYAPIPAPDWMGTVKKDLWSLTTEPKRLARALSFLCLVVMVLVLFVPRIGAYNNGDFGRMMDAMGLVHTPENYFDPAVQYQKVIERYDYLEPYDWTRIRPGKMELTQSWLSALMRALYELAGVPFSTAILAAIHLLTLTLCVYELLTALYRQWGREAALVGGLGYMVLFCGSYNLGWLNSLFGEGIAFVGLLLVLTTSVRTIQAETAAGRRWGLVLLAFSGVYLACAKAQYAVLAPVLLLWWAVLAVCTAEGNKKKWISAGGAVLVAVFLGSCALGVYNNNESISSQDTLYSGLMNGILLYADDPEGALEDLGLDPGLIADKGKHPYLPKEDYYCPPRTEKAEELLYSKVSSTKYLMWYLKHPKAFWRLLDDTAGYAADAMPDFNLYVGETNVGAHRTVNKWNLWAQIRPKILPRHFIGYILLFGILALLALGTIFRRAVDKKRKLYAGLLLVLLAIGAMQYPLPMVGNGRSDPIKQLYLFREIVDVLLLIIAAWAAKALFQRKKGT